MKRSYASGAQKRKAAEEKKRKGEQFIKTIPKISDMIGLGASSSRSDTSNAPSASTSGIGTISNETQHQEQQIEVREVASTSISDASGNENICEHENENLANVGESFLPDQLLPFPTDAALWDMDSGLTFLQAFWAKNG